jgi:tetratricopeptide (TPR) repeat protein
VRRLALSLLATIIIIGVILWFAVFNEAGGRVELAGAVDYAMNIDRSELPPVVANLVNERIAAVHANPESAQAWGALGEALDSHEVYAHAVHCYRTAQQLAPTEFKWSYLLAIATEYHGRDAEGAVVEFRQAASMAPEYPPVFFRLGEALARRARLDESRTAHEEALRLDPELAIAQRSLGQVLLQMNELRAAVELLEAAATSHPDDQTVWISLARAYQLTGRADEAAAASAQVAGLKPTMALPDPIRRPVLDQALTAERLTERAVESVANGNVQAAAQALSAAVDLAPNDAYLRVRLGNVYVMLGRPDSALVQFQYALELNERLPGAHVGVGLIDLAGQDPRSAVQRFRRAIEIDPNKGLAHAKLGTALAMSGSLDEAVRAFAEGERLNAMDAQSYLNWGTAMERLNDVGGAIRQYREAIRLNPRYARARASLGRLLETTGRRAEAIEQYRAIERIDPNHPAAQRLRQMEGR